jgi:hypothetical protein
LALYFPLISAKFPKVNLNQPDNPPPARNTGGRAETNASASPNPLPPKLSPGDPPPPGQPSEPAEPSSGRKLCALLMSLFLGLVLANAVFSTLDDACALLWGVHPLMIPSTIILFVSVPAVALVYVLMGLTPVIPKQIVLPVVASLGLPLLVALPAMIYYYQKLLWYDGVTSGAQVIVYVLLIRWLRGNWQFRWPLVADQHLGRRPFSWRNLLLFVGLNLLVLLPAAMLYLGWCATLAVHHFTGGFVALRPRGIVMQARKYTREDGRTVVLIPMTHIADADFYQSVARTVASNSVVLMEGVTDQHNLLTNRLSYRRAARSLHLAEQHEGLKLEQGRLIQADVDVQEFSSNTIAVLNLISLVHGEGLTSRTLGRLLQYSPSQEVEQQLFDDLLARRNRHVLSELKARLPESASFVIPWGAAHMAGLAREIEKSGFHLTDTRDYLAIGFGAGNNGGTHTDWVPAAGKNH